MHDHKSAPLNSSTQSYSNPLADIDDMPDWAKETLLRVHQSTPSHPKFVHGEEWLREREKRQWPASQIISGVRRFSPSIYNSLQPIRPAVFHEHLPFVVLLGDAGVGKSVTAHDLMLRYVLDCGAEFEWTNVTNLLRRIRASFRKNSRTENEEAIINQMIRRELLVLDDLGAEHVTDFGVSTVYTILNDRGERFAKTIITSNLTLAQISEKIDGRIASRLSRYGRIMEIKTNNVRPPNATTMPVDGVEHYAHPEIYDGPLIAK